MAANESVTSQPQGDASNAATIPLPAPAPGRSVADQVAPWAGKLDALLVVVILAFAFLTASFAATNNDLFFQMATGKLLAQNRYHFGVDPFACTTENVYWANHSWLFGVVTHAVYDSFPGHGTDEDCTGGIILVVAKALLVAMLAWLMIATGRQRGRSLWIPAACALLGILAMSPRLLLNSTTLSYVYLGLTLFLLRRPRWNPPPIADAPPKKGKAKAAAPVMVGYPFKALWAIPPLCVLWVNTDSWFFLGPLTVALYLAGELIEQAQAQPADRADRPLPGELKTLGYVLIACIGAGFINPHHYHAFTLPAQLGLSTAGETLRSDSQFRSLFLSPFESDYYSELRIGLSVAGVAYFPLLLLGLFSFALNYRTIRPWRVIVLLPFAGLSAIHMRAIPFFAVVAAPIMALNFLDFAAAFQTQDLTTPGWRGWRVGGRVLCVVAGLALIVCTIPGWVQAQPYERRRVAWNVHVEPSWKATGAQLAQWREQGLLQDGEAWFNTSPEAFNFLAYYGEGQRGFLDARLQLYDQAAADYVAVRKSFNLEQSDAAVKESRPPEATWRDVFTRHKVRYVILRDPPNRRFNPVTGMLLSPNEWTPLYADGDTFIFGWNHQQETPPSEWTAMRLNYQREAFGPGAKAVQRAQPPDPPHVREWYEALWQAEKPRSLAVNLSSFLDLYERIQFGRWQEQEGRNWRDAHLVVGAAVGWPAYPMMYHPGSPVFRAHEFSVEPPPPAPSYLSIRQIQQSLADNPDDSLAYLRLGSAYFKLFWDTKERERSYQLDFIHPTLIRHTQIVTALNLALKAAPGLLEQEAAHGLLAEHYASCRRFNLPNFYENHQAINYIDVELQHRQEQLRIKKARGKTPVASEEEAKQQDAELKRLEEEVKGLKTVVERQTMHYDLNRANKPVVQQAVEALKLGLGAEAQSVLEKADPKDLSVGSGSNPQSVGLGYMLRIKLLLSLGRVADARVAFTEDNKKLNWGNMPDLGMPAYAWFELLAAAAIGEYGEADKVLEGLEQQVRQRNETALPGLARDYAASLVMLGDPTPGSRFLALINNQTRQVAQVFLEQECETRTLRGWLALEAGNLDLARKEFRESLEMGRIHEPDDAVGAAVGVTLPAARSQHLPQQSSMLQLHALPLAEMGLRWMEKAAR